MPGLEIGDVVEHTDGEFEIGIVSAIFQEDGDYYVEVYHKLGTSIVKDSYDEECIELLGGEGQRYELEAVGLGLGRCVVKFRAKDVEAANKWAEEFLAGNATDALGRNALRLLKTTAPKSPLFVTYVKHKPTR